jgi:ABC-2 type transport system permease protein
MSNVLAIARKELKGYFSSPIAFIVIGFFALIFGLFYFPQVLAFERQGLEPAGLGGPPPNVNQFVIRPLFHNAAVIMLFILPMITMRTYSEEKRSGTIELLLTAPLSDLQIILGKFLGAMGLYTAMLAITLFHVGFLFVVGNPDWLPVVTGYLGLLLLGACFVSVGLLLSSMTKNQVVAGVMTFAVFLALWIINWGAQFASATWVQETLNYLSLTGHLDDFTLGVIDTKHLVYYVSVIAFGLFLTARSVDAERWRG